MCSHSMFHSMFLVCPRNVRYLFVLRVLLFLVFVCLFIVFIPCKKICEFSHFDSLLVVFGDLFVHSMPCFSSPSFQLTTSLETTRPNLENSKEKSTGCCTFTDDKDVGVFVVVSVNKASIPALRNWLNDCGVCIVVIF